MRHPAKSLGLGFAVAYCFSSLCGCVSAKSLRQVYQGVTDAQAQTLSGIDALDAKCEALSSSPADLAECRRGRGLADAGLHAQLNALSIVVAK